MQPEAGDDSQQQRSPRAFPVSSVAAAIAIKHTSLCACRLTGPPAELQLSGAGGLVPPGLPGQPCHGMRGHRGHRGIEQHPPHSPSTSTCPWHGDTRAATGTAQRHGTGRICRGPGAAGHQHPLSRPGGCLGAREAGAGRPPSSAVPRVAALMAWVASGCPPSCSPAGERGRLGCRQRCRTACPCTDYAPREPLRWGGPGRPDGPGDAGGAGRGRCAPPGLAARTGAPPRQQGEWGHRSQG